MKKTKIISLVCVVGYLSACAASDTSAPIKRVKTTDKTKSQSAMSGRHEVTQDVANHVKLASLRTEIPKETKITRSTKKSLVTYTHEVSAGETAYSLSKKYCSHIDDIKIVNGLNIDYKITAGQYLLIPRTRC